MRSKRSAWEKLLWRNPKSSSDTLYISSIDLKFAFYTAFIVAGRPLYQFVIMTFGLCNAAQRLFRLMGIVIPTQLRSNVFVYLDDLLIIAPDFETHLKYLRLGAECLRIANLTKGLKKSNLAFKCLDTSVLLSVGERSEWIPTAIQKMPEPKSVKNLRSSLGTAGWYRRFIRSFAALASRLMDALRKGTRS